MAPTDRPSRLERTESPARSSLVKISPRRPRAAWLWSVCRASVDLPQSIVPQKKTSSATSADLAPGHGQQRHGGLLGGQRAVQADQRQQLRPMVPRVDDGDLGCGGDDDVADPGRTRSETAPNQPGATACSRLRTQACPSSRAVQVAATSAQPRARSRGAAPAARRRCAARRPRARARGPGRSGGPSPRRPCRGRPSLPGTHRRQPLGQPADRLVDPGQLLAPLPGLAAVHVADLVEVAPVDVDQRRAGSRGPRRSRRRPARRATRRRRKPLRAKRIRSDPSRRSTPARSGSPGRRRRRGARRPSGAAARRAGRRRAPRTAR